MVSGRYTTLIHITDAVTAGEHTMSNSDIIAKFCATWKDRNIDALMEFFTEDAIYHNIPIEPPSVGTDAIRATIEMFTTAPETILFEVHNQAETAAGIVLNERTDTFTFGDTTITLRVMGTFELKDGKIAAWRDYFDMNQYVQQMPQ
jgi:limonene-1,2-epoxide hydrolase